MTPPRNENLISSTNHKDQCHKTYTLKESKFGRVIYYSVCAKLWLRTWRFFERVQYYIFAVKHMYTIMFLSFKNSYWLRNWIFLAISLSVSLSFPFVQWRVLDNLILGQWKNLEYLWHCWSSSLSWFIRWFNLLFFLFSFLKYILRVFGLRVLYSINI